MPRVSKHMYTQSTDMYALSNTERHTQDFDEAKLEYKDGGGWLVCSL